MGSGNGRMKNTDQFLEQSVLNPHKMLWSTPFHELDFLPDSWKKCIKFMTLTEKYHEKGEICDLSRKRQIFHGKQQIS